MIVILDSYGGNIASIQFALQRLGKESLLTSDKEILQAASHVILPGVSTAHHAMTQLVKLELVDVICQLQQPVLGICLGMQLLFECSTEGNSACLGILPGKIENLSPNNGLTIPHMGWNRLKAYGKESPLMKGVQSGSYVYFVHSYAVTVNDNTIAVTQYGDPFASMVSMNNFYGVQFHPERSGNIGEVILRNFIELK